MCEGARRRKHTNTRAIANVGDLILISFLLRSIFQHRIGVDIGQPFLILEARTMIPSLSPSLPPSGGKGGILRSHDRGGSPQEVLRMIQHKAAPEGQGVSSGGLEDDNTPQPTRARGGYPQEPRKMKALPPRATGSGVSSRGDHDPPPPIWGGGGILKSPVR